MAEDRSIDILDYILLILKRKWKLLGLGFSILLVSYLLIYFFVDEQFEAKAVIIPSEDDQLSSLSSMFKGLSNLPLGLGGLEKDSNIDLYITIIYSRTNLNSVIKEFGLYKEYDLNSMEKTRELLAKNIKTKETKEGAFEISVIADSREKSAAMTNFVVDRLNESIVQLNIRKSKENRAFLEKRYNEIKLNLSASEDSLRQFQEKSKILVADEQTKAIIETFSKLEADIAAKEIESSVYERMYGKNSPITQNAQISLEEFRSKLKSLKRGEGDSSFLISLSSIPKYSMNYYRLYRDVMINNTMLEVIVPLYESAKFQEQKETPILQIIDRAEPPELRAYPKRVLTAAIITFAIMLFVLVYLLVSEMLKNSQNPKIILLREELRIRKIKK